MQKVTLADRAGNHLIKRVGFSYLYLCFGPLYLVARLRWEGLVLGLLYYYFLPIPGMENLVGWIKTWGMNASFTDFVSRGLLYFRHGFASPRFYFALAFVLLFHILFSCICDNWLLKIKIKRKGLAPVTEEDARDLIGAKCVKTNVLLAAEVNEREHLFQQAEQVWEDKNLSYTQMISRRDVSTYSHLSAASPTDELAHKRHLDNAALLQKGIISKEEYEILEKKEVEDSKNKPSSN
jgi:hypothetical protein